MKINELIVHLIHAGMQHGFNLDVSIDNWDRHEETLEGVIEDNCYDCIGTHLPLDDLKWAQELALIKSWLTIAFEGDDYQEVSRILKKGWAHYDI